MKQADEQREAMTDALAPLLNTFGELHWQSGRGHDVQHEQIANAFGAVIEAALAAALPPAAVQAGWLLDGNLHFREEVRQALGEALQERLLSMAEEPDWHDSRELDLVIDSVQGVLGKAIEGADEAGVKEVPDAQR